MCTISEIITVCGPNPPGVTAQWWVEAEGIDTMASPSLANNTITADITLLPGYTFKKLSLVREESALSDESIGPPDSSSMKHVLTGFIKGTNPLNEAAIGQALGTPCVVVARETDGSFKVIGNKENHAMIEKITGTSGKHGSADRKGRTVVVSASGFIYTIPHYRGDTSIFPV